VVAEDGAEQLELLPELMQLHRDAVVLAGRLEAAERAVAEASGRDPSEQVRVTLMAAGRVGAVEVSSGWRSQVGASELAGAVMAASREASSRRLEPWAAEIRRDGGPDALGRGKQRDARTAPPWVPSGPADPSVHDSIRQLWYVLQDATDRFDQLAAEAGARARDTVTGRDPGGHVTAVVAGADLIEIEFDERWLAEASGYEIGTAATGAIAAGYQAADRRGEDSIDRRWPFPELEQLTGDPARLLANLGLPAAGANVDRERNR